MHNKRKLFLAFLMMQCYAVFSYAQNETSGIGNIGAEGHYGFVIAHRPSVRALQQHHLGGFMLTISKTADGRKIWQHLYHLPEIGIKYGFFGLGNKEQLGYAHALLPYIDVPLGNIASPVHLQIGWGAGYITKPYSQFDNYKNVAIGSKLNVVFAANFNTSFSISNVDKLKAAIGITHFSNGSAATPNLGINIATIQMQYLHAFGKKREIQSFHKPAFKRHCRASVFASGSFRQIYPSVGKTYWAATLSGNLLSQYSLKSAAGIGLDYFYDDSNNEKLRRLGIEPKPISSASRIGIAGTYEVIMSDFSILLQMGGYVKSQLKKDGFIYHRIGMRYMVSQHIYACINLKTHFAKADFLEWGIGYRFK
jgi:hypothetical protein